MARSTCWLAVVSAVYLFLGSSYYSVAALDVLDQKDVVITVELIEQFLNHSINPDWRPRCKDFLDECATNGTSALANAESRAKLTLYCDLRWKEYRAFVQAYRNGYDGSNSLIANHLHTEEQSDSALATKLRSSIAENLRNRATQQTTVKSQQFSQALRAKYGDLCPAPPQPSVQYDRYYNIKTTALDLCVCASSPASEGKVFSWNRQTYGYLRYDMAWKRNEPGWPVVYCSDCTDPKSHWRFVPGTQNLKLVNRATGYQLSLDTRGVTSLDAFKRAKAVTLANGVEFNVECVANGLGQALLTIPPISLSFGGVSAGTLSGGGLRPSDADVSNGNPLIFYAGSALASRDPESFGFFEVDKFKACDLQSSSDFILRDSPMNKWVNGISMQLNFGFLSRQLPIGAGFLASLVLVNLFPQATLAQQLQELVDQLKKLMDEMISLRLVDQSIKDAKYDVNVVRSKYLGDYMARKYFALKMENSDDRTDALREAALYLDLITVDFEIAITKLIPAQSATGEFEPTTQNIALAQKSFRLLVVYIMEFFNMKQEALLLKAYANPKTSCADLMIMFQLRTAQSTYMAMLLKIQSMLTTKRTSAINSSRNKLTSTIPFDICIADDPGYLGYVYYTAVDSGDDLDCAQAKTAAQSLKSELSFDIANLSYEFRDLKVLLTNVVDDTTKQCNLLRDQSDDGKYYQSIFTSFPNTAFLNG